MRQKPTRENRLARIAVSALFLTNGAIFANLIPRFPEIKSQLALSNAEYGLAIASFPIGALLAGLFAAVLIRKFRSSRVAVLGTILTSLGVLAAGLAPSGLTFAAALFCAGALDAITDVAQNHHGLRVQRRYGRSILNSFHAVWSIGALAGGLMAAGAIALGVPISLHLLISAVLFATVSVIVYRGLLPGPERDVEPDPQTAIADVTDTAASRPKVRARSLVLAALALVAIGGTIVEDAGSTWASVYLGRDLGAAPAVAAFGFIALVGAQFIGRLLGDGLVDRFGQRLIARLGGLLVFLGMGTALAFPSVGGTITGFALAGFGVATLVPAAMDAADRLPGLRPGTGLTLVSWLLRLGFLVSPPLVGLVADTIGLRYGLLIVPFAGILVVVLAGVLSKERSSAS
ncbi:MFS transporter [Humidisolicoccus flavus]|uniref:MFS transporter n=1 Tax=Humidisolicoccus flavus TaxID=3111414 RepID=UPI0032523FF8